jgi:putative addiction module component (TIGR02574 family)
MAVPQSLVIEALKLPAEEREELIHALLDSFPAGDLDDPHALSPAQLAELDESLAEADRGELVAAEAVLTRMRRIQ